ncbi:MAG: SpoIID/LytB domain-containing protein [Firmicutes bacterium]|nr:SpoIID/LytB domain-containing protein [Bacillota bacterium]
MKENKSLFYLIIIIILFFINYKGEKPIDLAIDKSKEFLEKTDMPDQIIKAENDIIVKTNEENKTIEFKQPEEENKVKSNEMATDSGLQPELNVIPKSSLGQKIRVVLNSTNFTSLMHNTVSVTSAGAYYVTIDDNRTECAGGYVFTVKDTDIFDKIFIRPIDINDKIKITSIKRHNVSPEYRGFLEICKKSGFLVIVNQLYLEEYLYAVVPSEMPLSFGLEALKVQAICARTYAIFQMEQNRFRDYNADVDDSVNCQVYNNVPENDLTVQAVNETNSQVITYNEQVIPAYFFSTSCGNTANGEDVWGSRIEYLRAKRQYTGIEFMDFIELIKTNEFNAYDNASPWFRWQVTMPHSVEVLARGQGQNVTRAKINGDIVEGELRIRQALNPDGYTIYKHDGSEMNNYTILPSSFFIVADNTIIGGGNGHGVGLSQYGVKGMIEREYSIENILKHYYPDTELVQYWK